MSIGLVMLQYVTASTSVIQTIYYDTMAKEAADAGTVRALSCIKQNQMTWSNTAKLKPNSGCDGATLTSSTAPKWYIAHPSNSLSYSTFEVDAPVLSDGGISISATGKVMFGQDENRTTTSGSQTYSKSTKIDIPYTEVSTIWEKAQGNVVREVSANAWNTCAIANELPYCWGGNAYGEAGNGPGAIRTTPTRVNSGALAGNQRVASIDTGNLAACAITKTGRLVCWGRQLGGQLGNNAKWDANILPTQVVGEISNKNITKVSMGDSSLHSCALTEGEFYCTGGNGYAQLGQIDYNVKGPLCDWPWAVACGTPISIRDKPRFTTGWPNNVDADLGVYTPVFGFSNRTFEDQSQMYGKYGTDIGSGSYGACGLLNGSTFCWGDRFVLDPLGGENANTKAASGWVYISPVGSDVAIGESTACMVVRSKAYCRGMNPGNNSIWIPGSGPIYVPNGAGTAIENTAIVAMDTSNDHGAICMRGNGNAYCWGNMVGYMPSNTSICMPAGCNRNPGKVAIDNNYSVSDITSGREHNCAVANGAAYCWGKNTYGELGTTAVAVGAQSNLPVRTSNAIGTTSGYAATDISSGKNHNCAIVNGRIFCWGANNSGQIGTVDTEDKPVPITPSGFIGPKGATDVSAGTNHSCGIVNGAAYCWGNNTYGQLGTGDRVSSTAARQVNLSGKYFTSISAGNDHTCGIAEGSVYCWGRNNTRQLGDNSSAVDRTTPTLIAGASGLSATDVSAGNGFTCAVIDSKAWCWGNNASGQVGKSGGGTQATPYKISVLDTSVFTDIEAGDNFACGIVNGFAHCWGDNSSGQLGRGTTGYRADQYQVLRINSPVTNGNTTSLSAGDSHACSITDGTSYCWGNNTNGKLGNNSPTASNTPVAVRADTGVFGDNHPYKLSAGGNGTCGLANGRIACWGAGSNGQIGVLGNIAPKLIPTWTDDYKVGTFVLDYDNMQIY